MKAVVREQMKLLRQAIADTRSFRDSEHYSIPRCAELRRILDDAAMETPMREDQRRKLDQSLADALACPHGHCVHNPSQ